MTDDNTDGGGSEKVPGLGLGFPVRETPRIRYGYGEKLGSILIITESVSFWVRSDWEREMVDQEYREAWVTSVVKTLKLMVSVQTLKLMVSAQVTSMLMLRVHVKGPRETPRIRYGYGEKLGSILIITESVRFWVRCDGEREMVDQEYREAWVTSVLKTLKLMVSVQGECAIQFQEYSEALLIPIVMV
ncbi:Dna-(Apurinic Or Apyrimidinic Site) Endonuclease [Manis pentadactyla]|nr:Dna-(Apurinic Or Apyrimidinic Site) Endonuclease [Manis pentadactyla]